MSSVNGSLMTIVFDDTRDTPMLGRTSADCFREAEWWRHRADLYLDAAVGGGVGTMALLLLLVLFPFASALSEALSMLRHPSSCGERCSR